ncbi:MAG: hypothetical protein H0T69_03675 [Thermoleophilaceae bacterium]|nr:hypothetical protein [Thermoleophilaceae bacterium]
MRMTNRALTLLLMLALTVPVAAAPSTAFAQSAGDDQYVDPFQDDETGNGDQGNTGGDQGNSGGDQGNSGSGDDTTTSDQTASQDSGDTAGVNTSEEAASSDATLPRTGFPLGELALVGVILLGGGFALRRAWPLPG